VKKLRKKFLTAALSFAIAVTSTLVCYASNQSDLCFSWYTVPTKNEQQPNSFEARDIIDNYDTIYLGNPDQKKAYLTFDAGYENGNVEKILDTLKKQDVKGAFFVLPHFITANPQLIQRMIDEGHLVCNHSTTHGDMTKIADFDNFKKEIEGVENIYRDQTGLEMSKYFRPPEGKFSEKTLEYAQKLGYKTVLWSVAYADWDNNKQPDTQKAKELVLSRIHNGCVILLHPTSATNAAILDDIITEMKNRGYEFCSLDEFE
jgi:peptidoglycan-N-acetylmuramic acid deacetylase